jgi:hypothetical protein
MDGSAYWVILPDGLEAIDDYWHVPSAPAGDDVNALAAPFFCSARFFCSVVFFK